MEYTIKEPLTESLGILLRYIRSKLWPVHRSCSDRPSLSSNIIDITCDDTTLQVLQVNPHLRCCRRPRFVEDLEQDL